jgi:hypothetical protein
MPTKMTIFFNQFQSGFSETFYHSSDDPASLAAAVPQALYQAAAAMRHLSVQVKAVRFTRLGGARRSLLIRPYPPAKGTRAGVADPGPDAVSTTAVYRIRSAGIAQRRIWCRGLADSDVVRDPFGNDLENPTLLGLREEYFNALSAAGFSIRYAQRPPDAGLVWTQVTHLVSSTTDPAHRTDISYAAPGGPTPALVVGARIQFRGISSELPRFPRQAQIVYQYDVGAVKWFGIAYALPGGLDVRPQQMQSTPSQFTQELMTLWNFERFGEHKTGRPFGSLRGRVRTVTLRR